MDNFFRSRAEGEALFCGKDVAESLGYKLPHKAVLAMLPKEFTREQVRELRMAQGLKPNPSDVLRQWTKRGYIRKMGEQDVYENLRA